MLTFLTRTVPKLQKARDNRLKLGLDLQGGMYVVLDVDIVKLLEDLAVRKDDQLTAVLAEVKEATKTEDELIFEVFKQKLSARVLLSRTSTEKPVTLRAILNRSLRQRLTNPLTEPLR